VPQRKSFKPPVQEVLHFTAADFRRVIQRVKKMSRAELHESFVKAGILTKKGNLTKRYMAA
jgi:hypothetical protein